MILLKNIVSMLYYVCFYVINIVANFRYPATPCNTLFLSDRNRIFTNPRYYVIFISKYPHNITLTTLSYRFSLRYKQKRTLCFKKTGAVFISFIIHSNDDKFTRNFYQM